MNKSTARFALVIGAVSALGPVAIDLYLPGLPSISRDLHTSQGGVELSLMSFFIGMTVSQLVYGPLSDRIGRRAPLLIGLSLFIAGSLACSMAPNIEVLIWSRLLQGLGGGAGGTVGSAVIRDLYTGYEAARLQATRMLVLGVSPILSPIVGAAIIAVAPWHWIFWISAGFGVLCVVLILTLLPETRPKNVRSEGRAGSSLLVYRSLLANPRFMTLVLAAGLAQGAFLAYIAGSSFVFITMNGASPTLYSLMFGLNAAGFIGLAQFSPQLMRRFGGERVLLGGMAALAVGGCLLLIAAVTGHAQTYVLSPLLFLGIAGIGLVFGPSVILALKDHGAVAGAASALIGFLQGLVGALGAGAVALFANGTAVPMTGVMAGFAVAGLAMALFAFRGRPPEAFAPG